MAQLLRGCGAAGWLIGSALFGWAGRGTAPSSPQGDQPPAITLRLNIPAYRLEVFERGILSRSYRTGVGMKDYPTPTGSFAIGHLVWNPRWVPPPAEWAKSDTAMPPGPANPMGRVKLFFAPLYFIHGTPDAGSIGRAFP